MMNSLYLSVLSLLLLVKNTPEKGREDYKGNGLWVFIERLRLKKGGGMLEFVYSEGEKKP